MDLNARLAALMVIGDGRRSRGRPRTGFSKALYYSDQVDELIRSGMKRWTAVKAVATLNKKTPLHISACRKRIADTDPHEYMEWDRVED